MTIIKNRLIFFALGFILLCFAHSRLLAEDAVGTLVRTTDLSCLTSPNCPDPNTVNPGAIGSPDPSGIAYLSEGPGINHLLISDAEVSEMDWLIDNQNVNIFETTLSGDLVASSNIIPYSDEPTGMAFNPVNLHVFISDDVKRRIFEVDPGADGQFGTADDTIVAEINTRNFNSTDPEGIAYDHIEGAIYLSDGVNAQIYKILPGPNGQFDGVSPDGDDIVTSFDTLSIGVDDPEGIEWDPVTGNLYIVGNPETRVAEVTTTGALVRMIDISAANADKPAGLALAPWSGEGVDPYPDVLNLYIVDRGVDNNNDPNENDGKVYEISFPGTPFGGGPQENRKPGVSAGPDQIINLTSTCSDTAISPCTMLTGTVTDDGLPNPPAQVTINWSLVSGPGAVDFGNQSAAETTATFSTEGVYVLRLTADDSELSNSDDVQITVLPPPSSSSNTIYVTTDSKSGTVSDVAFGREDILRYDIDTDSWSVHFDGSHAGLGSADVNSFHILADGSILFTTRDATTLPDVGFVDNADIIRFIPTSLGENNTAGVFELYFKGANVGLGPSSETGGEKIDAIGFLPDGRLLVSISGSFSVPGVSGRDEDLIAFTATSLGENTSGSWELYLDGSNVDLSDEDVDGVWVSSNGDIYLTTKGDFSVSGVSGDGADIFRCQPQSTGSNPSCNYDLVWSGSAHGLGGHNVNGIHLAQGTAGNSAPTVTIDAPANDATFSAGEAITFSGTATDSEDGDLTSSLAWSSSLDGALGNGGSVVTSSLSMGTHVITATASDSGGLSDSPSINVTISTSPTQNTAPTVTIDSPANNATFSAGESITFTGTAADTEDGVLTSSLAWSSSLDGALGNGGSVATSSLSEGSHTITATVSDSGGLSGSNSIDVTITSSSGNTAPSVTIDSPANESTFSAGEAITFTGTAADSEDGDLTSSLAWNSSLDGALGNGGSVVTSSLSVGTHLITATVSDSGGLSDSHSISVTVSSSQSQLAGVYVSTDTKLGSVGNISFGREDIIRYDTVNDTWSVHFDGSHAGLGSEDINSFHILADGSILFTLRDATTLPDVGGVDNADIIRFIPTSLGENNTTGVFELYFKGANVGLGPSSQTGGEKIDALSFLPDGRLLVSISGSFSVPGVSGSDEDLIAFTATSLGETTSGSWELYLDGSNVELGEEDADGASISSNGDIYLTTKGDFTVSGVSGDGADIFRCQPQSTGSNPGCTYDLVWSGSSQGLAGHNINGVHVILP